MGKSSINIPLQFSDSLSSFRESSRKLVVDISSKNSALNLSGALLLIGLGCSLKWWYNDQLLTVLLKNNLPALSEPQQKISRETGEHVLAEQADEFRKEKGCSASSFLRGTDGSNNNREMAYGNNVQFFDNLIERIDLYANSVVIKLKSPWEKHAYHRFVGVFPEKGNQHRNLQNPINLNDVAANFSIIGDVHSYTNESGIIKVYGGSFSEETNNVHDHVMGRVQEVPFSKDKEGDINSIHRVSGAAVTNRLNSISNNQQKPAMISHIDGQKYTFSGSIYPESWFKLSARGLCIDQQDRLANIFFQQIVDCGFLPKLCSGYYSLPFLGKVNKFTPNLTTHHHVNEVDMPKDYYFLAATRSSAINNDFIDFPTAYFGKALEPNHGNSIDSFTNGLTSIWCSLMLPSAFTDSPGTQSGGRTDKINAALSMSRRVEPSPAVPRREDSKFAYLKQIANKKMSAMVLWNHREGGPLKVKKLSYPLELTTTMVGWQPPVNTLILNSYLDEIPYKLETYLPGDHLVSGRKNQLQDDHQALEDSFLIKEDSHKDLIEIKKVLTDELSHLVQSLAINLIDRPICSSNNNHKTSPSLSWSPPLGEAQDSAPHQLTHLVRSQRNHQPPALNQSSSLVNSVHGAGCNTETTMKLSVPTDTPSGPSTKNRFAYPPEDPIMCSLQGEQKEPNLTTYQPTDSPLLRRKAAKSKGESVKEEIGQIYLKPINNGAKPNPPFMRDDNKEAQDVVIDPYVSYFVLDSTSCVNECGTDTISSAHTKQNYMVFANGKVDNSHLAISPLPRLRSQRAADSIANSAACIGYVSGVPYGVHQDDWRNNEIDSTAISEADHIDKGANYKEVPEGNKVDGVLRRIDKKVFRNDLEDSKSPLDPLSLLGNLNITFNNLSTLNAPSVLLPINSDVFLVSTLSTVLPASLSTTSSTSLGSPVGPYGVHQGNQKGGNIGVRNLRFQKPEVDRLTSTAKSLILGLYTPSFAAKPMGKTLPTVTTKKTTLADIDHINTVDKNISFSAARSRLMSGYVYPDMKSNPLESNLYRWLSGHLLQRKIHSNLLTKSTPLVLSSQSNSFAINVNPPFIRDDNREAQDVVINPYISPPCASLLSSPFGFARMQAMIINKKGPCRLPHQDPHGIDKRIPTVESTYRDLFQKISRVFDQACLMNLQIPITSATAHQQSRLSREQGSSSIWCSPMPTLLPAPLITWSAPDCVPETKKLFGFAPQVQSQTESSRLPALPTSPTKQGIIYEARSREFHPFSQTEKDHPEISLNCDLSGESQLHVKRKPTDGVSIGVKEYDQSRATQRITSPGGSMTALKKTDSNAHQYNKKLNYRFAHFPGFTEPNQFFQRLAQDNTASFPLKTDRWDAIISSTDYTHNQSIDIAHGVSTGVKPNNTSVNPPSIRDDNLGVHHMVAQNGVDINCNENLKVTQKKFNNFFDCNVRKTAYQGIVVPRDPSTKDFQLENNSIHNVNPLESSKGPSFVVIPYEGRIDTLEKSVHLANKTLEQSSNWATHFLGPENPLTDRQPHFFGQRRLDTMTTRGYQRDYLRDLAKEALAQSTPKGLREKSTSVERLKILSFSKSPRSFPFKKQKYAYLLEKNDEWHLLFQEQFRAALEDPKLVRRVTPEERSSLAKNSDDGSGRIKVAAPLATARFPAKRSSEQCLASIDKWDPLIFVSTSKPIDRVNTVDSTLSLPCVSLESQNGSWHALGMYQGFPGKPEGFHRLRVGSHQKAEPFIGDHNLGVHHMVAQDSLVLDSTSCVNECGTDVISSAHTKQNYMVFAYGDAHYDSMDSVNRNGDRKERTELMKEKSMSTCWPPYALPYGGHQGNQKGGPLLLFNGDQIDRFSLAAKTSIACHYPLPTETMLAELNGSLWFNGGTTSISLRNSGRKGESSLTTPSTRSTSMSPSMPSGKNLGKLSFSAAPAKPAKLQNEACFFEPLLNATTQEPLTSHSWHIITQWCFLVALLFWVEQMLLEGVFPALSALEQLLLGAIDMKSSDRTRVIRVIKGDVNTPKFQDIAGVDGLLGELSELVLFLRGHKEQLWNRQKSQGVLLTGPPGTGKTFLVRALAGEAKVPVLILSAGALAASKVSSNKPSWSIRHAFRRARQLAPCILFIDELDALGRSRGEVVTDVNEIVAHINHHNQEKAPSDQRLPSIWCSPMQSPGAISRASLLSSPVKGGSNDTINRPNSYATNVDRARSGKIGGEDRENRLRPTGHQGTRSKFGPLTQLLVSMDGVSNLSGVLVLGATNRPESLDPALTRPGRFERVIRVEKPAEEKRIEILKLYSRKLGVQHQIPWSYLANRTVGLTAADLAVAMNYSSLKAILQGSMHTVETIEYGLDSIVRFDNKSTPSLVAASTLAPLQPMLSAEQTVAPVSLQSSLRFPEGGSAGSTMRGGSLKKITKTKKKIVNKVDFHSKRLQNKLIERLSQIAYYQAGKTVIQTLLPLHPPVALVRIDLSGITAATSADTYIPIDNASTAHWRSSLEARLIGLYGGKAASLLILSNLISGRGDRIDKISSEDNAFSLSSLDVKRSSLSPLVSDPLDYQQKLKSPDAHGPTVPHQRNHETDNVLKSTHLSDSVSPSNFRSLRALQRKTHNLTPINSAQSDLGSQELQIGTRLADRMVNEWGFYSWGKQHFDSESTANLWPRRQNQRDKEDVLDELGESKLLIDGDAINVNECRADAIGNAISPADPALLALANTILQEDYKLQGKSADGKGITDGAGLFSNFALFEGIINGVYRKKHFSRSLSATMSTLSTMSIIPLREARGSTNLIARTTIIPNLSQLIHLLHLSTAQRDRLYPSWFRLYLPDMEATELMRNAADYYLNGTLKLQDLLNLSGFAPDVSTGLTKTKTIPVVNNTSMGPNMLFAKALPKTAASCNRNELFTDMLELSSGFPGSTSRANAKCKARKKNSMTEKDYKGSRFAYPMSCASWHALCMYQGFHSLSSPMKGESQKQTFSIDCNDLSMIEKEFFYHALVTNCFTKALLLADQNRQLLDYFTDYLLRFKIIRQDRILYLFSTLLLNRNKGIS